MEILTYQQILGTNFWRICYNSERGNTIAFWTGGGNDNSRTTQVKSIFENLGHKDQIMILVKMVYTRQEVWPWLCPLRALKEHISWHVNMRLRKIVLLFIKHSQEILMQTCHFELTKKNVFRKHIVRLNEMAFLSPEIKSLEQ